MSVTIVTVWKFTSEHLLDPEYLQSKSLAIMASIAKPATTKLWLRSYNDPGYYYRDVSTRPPRDCTADEVPMIDLSRMRGSLENRTALGKEIIHAAETTGFFYIRNHGVPEGTITRADEKLRQSVESRGLTCLHC